mmetsp:Transcript_1633/g.2889  ORF Transcript_1633/g.2889 Transcript_1633/m.2889 type:complete len:158 (+) Transcript_1633:448-921(+)
MLLPFNRFSETLALFSLGGSFGAWIGIIFSEADNMYGFEIVLYYVQHMLASFFCPMIMYFNHRFDPLRYLTDGAAPIMPLFAYTLFSIYMRLVLTPLSAISWANLNHTLCGVGNDPMYSGFDLGKWYYFFAEYYLMIPSVALQYLNAYLGVIFFGKF